jgi:hypothetical protein
MFIVLIHWRIKPTEEHISAFQEFWRKMSINDDNNLIGEFLSKPLTAGDVSYPIDPVVPNEPEPYQSFVNVGIWKDEPSFLTEIGKYIPHSGSSLKEFEQYPRRRIPLDPKFWRRGKFQLPSINDLQPRSQPNDA